MPKLIPPSQAHDPWIGHVLAGRYTLVGKLGAGSMGTVYRATQLAVDRAVAVKILKDDRSVDAAANARFQREARANSLLVSPHTVQVVDFGQGEGGELFLVMELLEGESLRKRLSRMGRFPADVAVDTCVAVLRSLTEAHAKGVIHRDLKPEHIFFAQVKGERQGHEIVKVLDFGIAKMVGEESKHLNAVETREGRILGTPRYMSPEQAQGRPLDARSDLYTAGVILYEMLAGRPPFTAEDPIVVMAQHITKTPRLVTEACPEARVPPELERLVSRVLSKDPTARPVDAEAMAEQLAAALADTRDGAGAGALSARVATRVVPATASTERGTPSGVVLSHADSETIPTLDPRGGMDGTTVEHRPRRGGKRLAVAASMVGAVGAIVFGAAMLRGADGSQTAVASRPPVAESAAPTLPTPPSATASVPAGTERSISVDALPSATSGRSRRPSHSPASATGPRSPSRPPGAAPAPKGSGGYEYLE